MTLADVPEEVWDDVARPGIDAVWLMGVWERSPAGAAIARTNPAMVAAQREALADVTDADVVGSAYCIRRYRPDPRFGGATGAGGGPGRAGRPRRAAAARLGAQPRGARPPLGGGAPRVLHPLDPRGARRRSRQLPRGRRAGLRPGRDPYFPAWPEVLQLDTTASATRRAAAAELGAVAERCDGVRCDMAMLVLDEVVARTWGPLASTPDGAAGYWPAVMAAVRSRHPGFAFFAEAYWGLEGALLEAGLRRLLRQDPLRPPGPRRHRRCPRPPGRRRSGLAATAPCGSSRTTTSPGPRRASTRPGQRAAALLLLTTPGVALLHEGQFEGRRVRVPVTLGRRPDERPDVELAVWYRRLLDRTRRASGSGGVRGPGASRPAGPTTAAASSSAPGAGAGRPGATWSW